MTEATKLHNLVRHGAVDAVAAEMAASPRSINARDDVGRTPLHFAAAGDTAEHGAILRALLKAGADVSAADDSGQTALHYAARESAFENVGTLLHWRASPDVADKQGRLPVELVPGHAHRETVRLLEGAAVGSEALAGTAITAAKASTETDLVISHRRAQPATALSPVAREIYDGVFDAMQSAEELGGPEDDDYVALMEAISREATTRVAAFREAKEADRRYHLSKGPGM